MFHLKVNTIKRIIYPRAGVTHYLKIIQLSELMLKIVKVAERARLKFKKLWGAAAFNRKVLSFDLCRVAVCDASDGRVRARMNSG